MGIGCNDREVICAESWRTDCYDKGCAIACNEVTGNKEKCRECTQNCDKEVEGCNCEATVS